MVDYAKIDKIIEYSEKKYFPFHEWHTSLSSKGFKSKLTDIIRIILNHSPVNTVYGKKSSGWQNPFYGTRRWEYPWVYEQLSALPERSKIIDCGCGVSKFPVWLADKNYEVSALDFFVENPNRMPGYGITKSHRKKYERKVSFIDGSMFDIPVKDNSFDAAICISVMEHIVKRDDAEYHLKTLLEMNRLLKPGGLLICTYDTILNPKVFFADIANWGSDGWYYKNDIIFLLENGMKLKNPECHLPSREQINMNESTFFIPPHLYFPFSYGSGFELFGKYHRLTSVGFVLVKNY